MQNMSNDVMNHDGNGLMGGYGIWLIVGILLAVFLVAAIVRMVRAK